MKRVVGAAVVGAVMTSLFLVTAAEHGVYVAAQGWAVAIMVAGLLVVGVWMAASHE